MFVRTLITSVLLFSCLNADAQSTFKKAYGGSLQDGAYDVQPTFDGGYIICGFTFTFGSELDDQYVIKTDSAGNMEWTRTVSLNCGNCSNNIANEILQLSDSSYVFAGYRNTATVGYANLVKLSAAGDTVWVRSYDGLSGNSVKATGDGGLVLAGTIGNSTVGNNGFGIVKCDSSGNVIWSKSYSENVGCYFWKVLVAPDSGYFLTGERTSPVAFDKDIYVVRTNSVGDTLWTRTYSSPGSYDDRLYSATNTIDGGVLLTGYTNGFSSGDYDIILLKLDSTGTLAWGKVIGTSGNEFSRMSTQLSDSGYVVVGTSGTTSFLCKLSSVGNLHWVKSTGNHAPIAVHPTPNGQLVVAGWTYVVGGGDVYLSVSDTAYNLECGESGFAFYCTDITASIVYGNSAPQVASNTVMEISSADAIDTGGQESLICLTSIQEQQYDTFFNRIYPNPATDELQVESNVDCAYYISDELGRIVLSGIFEAKSNTLDVSTLSNGVYFLRSTTAYGGCSAAPIIIAH